MLNVKPESEISDVAVPCKYSISIYQVSQNESILQNCIQVTSAMMEMMQIAFITLY